MLHNNVAKQSYDTKRYYICAGTDEKGYVKEGDYMEMKMEWIKCPVCGNKSLFSTDIVKLKAKRN